jgi:peroxiredoxin
MPVEAQMKRLFYTSLLLATLLFSLTIGAPTSWAQDFKVGSQVTDFPLTKLDGTPVQFSGLRGNYTVVMFISAQCPVSNSYNERMNALYQDYTHKGVTFIAINSNSTESVDWVKQHAKEHNFPFTVYKDVNNVVADKFGATVTPETYIIDSSGKVRYHGSIDDSQTLSRVKTQRLRAALDAVLAGQQPPQLETKAFGCSIKRAAKVGE